MNLEEVMKIFTDCQKDLVSAVPPRRCEKCPLSSVIDEEFKEDLCYILDNVETTAKRIR